MIIAMSERTSQKTINFFLRGGDKERHLLFTWKGMHHMSHSRNTQCHLLFKGKNVDEIQQNIKRTKYYNNTIAGSLFFLRL